MAKEAEKKNKEHDHDKPPMPKVELAPGCKMLKAKDGKGKGKIICDMEKKDVPMTKGGEPVKLKPQDKDGKEMEGAVEAVLEGSKDDKSVEKKEKVAGAMKKMMGGDDDKKAHKDDKKAPKDDKKAPRDDMGPAPSWGPAHKKGDEEKVDMGPMDAKMKLVKKEE